MTGSFTMRKRFMLVFALACFTPLGVLAGGDTAAGKTKANEAGCVTCHGQDGNGVSPRTPNVPKLAGQYASFLAQALKDYKTGKRVNAIMSGFAANLTDEDRENIAAYYASQSGLRVLE